MAWIWLSTYFKIIIHTNSYYFWIFQFQWHSLWNKLSSTIVHTIFYEKTLCTVAKKMFSSEIPWNIVIDMWSKATRISLNLWKSDLFLSKTTFADVNSDLTNPGMLIKLSQQYEVSKLVLWSLVGLAELLN